MGHFSQIHRVGSSVDILAQGEGQFPLGAREAIVFEQLSQRHHLAVAVGELEPNCVLARNRCHHTDAFHLEGHGDFVRQAANLRELCARLGLELEHGHHRAGVYLTHIAVNGEIGQYRLETIRGLFEIDLVDLAGAL